MIQTASMVLRGGMRLLSPILGDDAARDARLLMAHVLGVEPGRLTVELSRTVNPAQVRHFESLIERRLRREPVSQILGRRLFWGRSFKISQAVLDPRPETEVLVAEALKAPARRILDLGTGSGCILLSLLAEWEEATGFGVDLSEAALDVARDNAAALDLSNRASFARSDWWDGVNGTFDLIVSNPPYVTEAEMADLSPEVLQWEPRQALTPGGDGLSAYRTLASGLAAHLTSGGRAFFEIGATQVDAVSSIFTEAGFSELTVYQDMDGRDRVVQVA